MKIPYKDQLRDPRWQKRRLLILELANWKCQCCGGENKTLEIHHRFYKAGTLAWDYPDDSLIVVCRECHDCLALFERSLLCSINPKDYKSIIGLANVIAWSNQRNVSLSKLVAHLDKKFFK